MSGYINHQQSKTDRDKVEFLIFGKFWFLFHPSSECVCFKRKGKKNNDPNFKDDKCSLSVACRCNLCDNLATAEVRDEKEQKQDQ